MSTNEDYVKLERALLVQMSAKKFYSTISELDDQQKLHLKRIDSTIEMINFQRAELWKSDPRIAEDPNELQVWRNSRQSMQSEISQKNCIINEKSYLDLEDPVKKPVKKLNILMIVTLTLLLAAAAAVGISQALKNRPADSSTYLPTEESSDSQIGQIDSQPANTVATSTASSETEAATTAAAITKPDDIPAIIDAPIVDTPQPPANPNQAVPATPPPSPPVTSALPPSPPQPSKMSAPAPPRQPLNVNILENGDFAKSACPGATKTCYSSDSSTISPWRVTSAETQYEINPPGLFTFNPTSYAMDLNSSGTNSAYTVTQTLRTEASFRYKVTFNMNENPCPRIPLKTGFVQASGNPRQDFTASTTTVLYEYLFTATGSSTDVSIGGTNSGSCGPVIFGVQAVRIG